jgi:hypothetical protein
MRKPKPDILLRYTNLAATIHMLRSRTITLLNPGTWDDRNDAYFMAEYKRRRNLKTLLALCFANCDETYHHWRVFSHGPAGVRVEFDRTRLLEAFEDDENVTGRTVNYKRLTQLDDGARIQVKDLPFLKRKPFRDESEFRIIYENADSVFMTKDFAIDLGSIRRITLSPWIVKSQSSSVIANLRQIQGCKNLKIYRSTLVDNERWQSLASNAS